MAINRTKVLDKAQKYQRKGNLEKAIREYDKLAEDDPSDMRSRLKIADLHTKLEQVDEALAAYRDVAYYYLRDEIYDKSVAIFKQAIRLNREDPELHRDLGEAYHRLGRLKEALGQYNQAQRIYAKAGEKANQRDILERMVRLDPEDVSLRIQLAEHYIKASMREDALELFKYAARQLEEDGRLDDWRKVFERIVFLRPRDMDLRMRLVRSCIDARDLRGALKHLKVCFKSRSQDLEVLRLLSRTFEELGQRDKALLVYRELAKVYRDRGDERRSHQTYKHILGLNPNDREARKMLAYDARKKKAAAQKLEDSGSLPGLQETGNLEGDPLHQSHQEPPSRRDVMADVEFLDDDLEEVLAPSTSSPPARPQPPPQPPPPKPPPRPERPGPGGGSDRSQSPGPNAPQARQRPQPPESEDELLSFAADAISDLGDIEFDNLQSYPTTGQHQRPSPQQPARPQQGGAPDEVPVLELEPEPVELEPEPAEVEEDLDVRQAIDEATVFLKYGLRDKAIQTLLGVARRFPDALAVREELIGLYRQRGDDVLAADQYLEMARIVRTTPRRAVTFLEKAAELFGDRSRVEAAAAQLDVPFGESLDDEQDGLLELDFLSDERDVDDVFNSIASNPHVDAPPPHTQQPPGPPRGRPIGESSSVYEIDEGDLLMEPIPLADEAATGDVDVDRLVAQDASSEPGLEFATDDLITEGELTLEGAEVIEVDELAELPEETDVELSSLRVRKDARPRAAQTDAPEVDFGLSEDEADAMFDDLFGDVSSPGVLSSFAGDKDLSGVAEVDFLLERGMTSEAEEALNELERDNPNSTTVQRRRLSLENARAGAGSNPFGARSLSQEFAYSSLDENTEDRISSVSDDAPSIISAGNATNTNFELGASYMELGLYEEAIKEFRLSLDDDEVARKAHYNMATCHIKLGQIEDAQQLLTQLLERPDLPQSLRQSASNLLRRTS